jgi:hypothetical protein
MKIKCTKETINQTNRAQIFSHVQTIYMDNREGARRASPEPPNLVKNAGFCPSEGKPVDKLSGKPVEKKSD